MPSSSPTRTLAIIGTLFLVVFVSGTVWAVQSGHLLVGIMSSSEGPDDTPKRMAYPNVDYYYCLSNIETRTASCFSAPASEQGNPNAYFAAKAPGYKTTGGAITSMEACQQGCRPICPPYKSGTITWEAHMGDCKTIVSPRKEGQPCDMTCSERTSDNVFACGIAGTCDEGLYCRPNTMVFMSAYTFGTCVKKEGLCGNGIIDKGEHCDDGPKNGSTEIGGCNAKCQTVNCCFAPPTKVDEGEEEDETPATSPASAVSTPLKASLLALEDGEEAEPPEPEKFQKLPPPKANNNVGGYPECKDVKPGDVWGEGCAKNKNVNNGKAYMGKAGGPCDETWYCTLQATCMRCKRTVGIGGNCTSPADCEDNYDSDGKYNPKGKDTHCKVTRGGGLAGDSIGRCCKGSNCGGEVGDGPVQDIPTCGPFLGAGGGMGGGSSAAAGGGSGGGTAGGTGGSSGASSGKSPSAKAAKSATSGASNTTTSVSSKGISSSTTSVSSTRISSVTSTSSVRTSTTSSANSTSLSASSTSSRTNSSTISIFLMSSSSVSNTSASSTSQQSTSAASATSSTSSNFSFSSSYSFSYSSIPFYTYSSEGESSSTTFYTYSYGYIPPEYRYPPGVPPIVVARVPDRFVPQNCGDGKPDAGEQCDEGVENSNNPTARCRTDCRLAGCGDGITDTPRETCDDGNGMSGDGCSEFCQYERAAPNVLPGNVLQVAVDIGNNPTAYGLPGPIVGYAPPQTTKSGPAAIAIMAAGASAGYAWMKRKKKSA